MNLYQPLVSRSHRCPPALLPRWPATPEAILTGGFSHIWLRTQANIWISYFHKIYALGGVHWRQTTRRCKCWRPGVGWEPVQLFPYFAIYLIGGILYGCWKLLWCLKIKALANLPFRVERRLSDKSCSFSAGAMGSYPVPAVKHSLPQIRQTWDL